MSMLKGTSGSPKGEDYGPALGRGLGGVGNASDTPSTNGPLSQKKAMDAMPGMQHDRGNMQMDQMGQELQADGIQEGSVRGARFNKHRPHTASMTCLPD